jgi:hypothetical protein
MKGLNMISEFLGRVCAKEDKYTGEIQIGPKERG